MCRGSEGIPQRHLHVAFFTFSNAAVPPLCSGHQRIEGRIFPGHVRFDPKGRPRIQVIPDKFVRLFTGAMFIYNPQLSSCDLCSRNFPNAASTISELQHVALKRHMSLQPSLVGFHNSDSCTTVAIPSCGVADHFTGPQWKTTAQYVPP